MLNSLLGAVGWKARWIDTHAGALTGVMGGAQNIGV
jgi:hypothetical protein